MDKRSHIYAALVLIALVLVLVPGRALAHGGHVGPTQTYTQAVGPYELAVTLEMPPATPGPLYLDIVPPDDIGAATIAFRAVPRGQSFESAQPVEVQTTPGPQGVYFTQVDVDRPGDWDVEVRVDGPQGSGIARIPFTIVVQTLPPYTLPLLGALGGLVLLMLSSILLSVIAQRRQRPLPGWVNWVLGQGMFACLIVGAIFGFQQISSAVQSAQAAATGTIALGRPHVNVALRTEPVAPSAGQPLTLTIDLSDGSTGLPVEDLIPHHEALMHLVVISEDGGFFAHVHPPRMAPGRYTIPITPDRPGRYTAYAEIERQDSGTQVIARDFAVSGAATPSTPAASGLGTREVDRMQITVTSSVEPLKAGRQATLTFSFSANGTPANDMQPWLGMAGHLIARNQDSAIYAHVHAAEPMAPSGPAAAGIRYGPDIRFVYTFPQPGRYQLWGQFKHDGKIVTVPLVIEVGE